MVCDVLIETLSFYKFWIEFKSWFYAGQSTSTWLSFNKFWKILDAYIESLSCIKIHVTAKLSLSNSYHYISHDISIYKRPILLIIFFNGPLPCQEKEFQIITFPPPCFKVFIYICIETFIWKTSNVLFSIRSYWTNGFY